MVLRQAVVRRKGRRLVGVAPAQYKRIVGLRNTQAGELSVTAVVARLIEIGLEKLEATGHAGHKKGQ